ncbi:unnamed protein product [Bathycoccus prasinos]
MVDKYMLRKHSFLGRDYFHVGAGCAILLFLLLISIVSPEAYTWDLLEDRLSCVHGYVSTTDGKCVCNTDWSGERCEINPAPSCDRLKYGSCGDVLFQNAIRTRPHIKEKQEIPTCKCVDECLQHDLTTFGVDIYEEILRQNERLSFDITEYHVCKERDGTYRNSFVQELNVTKRLERRMQGGALAARSLSETAVHGDVIKEEDRTRAYRNRILRKNNRCSKNCERFGKCELFECACSSGRFGMDCEFDEEELEKAKIKSEKRNIKNELSVSVADLPGGIRRFFRGISVYHKRQDGRQFVGVHNFLESLLQNVDVIDPNSESEKALVVVPFFPVDILSNLGGEYVEFKVLLRRVLKYVSTKYISQERTMIWINAFDRSLCTPADTFRQELPPGAIVLSQSGVWRFSIDQEPCFLEDRDIVIPSALSSERGYFGISDPTHQRFEKSTKDGYLLFFKGSLRKREKFSPLGRCMGDKLFLNITECAYLYSQGVRAWLVDYYKDEKRFFLNQNASIGETYEEIRLKSKFCLVAGGAGWDQRFIDSIHHGCVPLLTQLNYSYPFHFIFDYDQFSVYIPAGSQKLKEIPVILETLGNGNYSKLLRNLRVVHEAISWSVDRHKWFDKFTIQNGAFYHTLWALSLRTNKALTDVVARKLCKLYYKNPYHATAYDILSPVVWTQLKQRCINFG